LLFAKREALSPVFDSVQLTDQSIKPNLFKHESKPLCGKAAFVDLRVQERTGQTAKWQVGALRHKERPSLTDSDLAAAKRPNPGNRP
jgi:hypothetical protein